MSEKTSTTVVEDSNDGTSRPFVPPEESKRFLEAYKERYPRGEKGSPIALSPEEAQRAGSHLLAAMSDLQKHKPIGPDWF